MSDRMLLGGFVFLGVALAFSGCSGGNDVGAGGSGGGSVTGGQAGGGGAGGTADKSTGTNSTGTSGNAGSSGAGGASDAGSVGDGGSNGSRDASLSADSSSGDSGPSPDGNAVAPLDTATGEADTGSERCVDQCVKGTTRCFDLFSMEFCRDGNDGCVEWSPPSVCSPFPATECFNGTCGGGSSTEGGGD